MAVKRFERNTLKLPSSTVHDHLNLIRELRQVFQQLRIHQVRVRNRWPFFFYSETYFCSTALHENLYLLWMETSLLHCTSGLLIMLLSLQGWGHLLLKCLCLHTGKQKWALLKCELIAPSNGQLKDILPQLGMQERKQ